MALLDARCTSCGAALKVNGGLDAANCEHCGAAFIVEKAVQNFYGNVQMQNATTQNHAPSDFVIRGGVLLKYKGAATVVTVPDGVVAIGAIGSNDYRGAFQECSQVIKITLPDSVQTIGSSAFYECKSLRDINIPNGVTTIGYRAFRDCEGLTKIVFPYGLKEISTSAFVNCVSLKKIALPHGLKEIGDSAFNDCKNLVDVLLPNSLKTIGSHAFSNCIGLKSITIPDSVVEIQISAFGGCKNLGVVNKQKDYTCSHYDKLLSSFEGTPWATQDPMSRKLRWKYDGMCIYCGSSKNIFGKCKKCGKRS